MVVEKCTLSLAEDSHIDRLLGIDSHASQRFVMRHRRDDQPARIFKADEAAVKEVIDGRGQEKSILSIKTFLIA